MDIYPHEMASVPRCGISSKLRSAKRHASVAFNAAFCEATSERLGKKGTTWIGWRNLQKTAVSNFKVVY